VVMGPDGSGKSTIAEGLARWASAKGPVRRFHHRFGTLPMRKEARVATTEPHRDPPYPRWLTAVKIVYLFVEHLLGLARQRPFLRRGGWVILERGWWDLVVDPRRYRLDPRVRLAERLGPLLPAPAATVILLAPAEVIAGRKSELAPEELQRQLDLWRDVAARIPRSLIVDATPSTETVLDAIVERLERRQDEGPAPTPVGDAVPDGPPDPGGWVALPPGRAARWWVPRRPPAAARGALAVFQPMTLGGRARWEALRVATAVRAFELLPPRPLPDLPDAVLRVVPRGGSVSVRTGTRPGRSVAVVLSPAGAPLLLAKIAVDPESREALAREADAIERIACALRPPVTAPRVVAVEDGVTLFEPVPWVSRRRPWELPEELARGIARLRTGTGDAARGPGHGDFAPWNVMATRDGWVVIDWESATFDAPPFDDLFHYLVQGAALLGHPRTSQIVAGLEGRGALAPAVRAYADVVGHPVDGLPNAFLGYLDRSTATLRLDRPDGARGLAARRRLRAAVEAAAHGR
jgi:thymidylate kinase